MLHQRSRTKGHHACAIRPLSHGTSVNKQGSFHTREWTRFRAKNYASVRFCRRSRPTTKFLNVCENFARNVGHVKHYCPFTRSSFCNISQTLRKFRKECWFFFVVWKGLNVWKIKRWFSNCYSEIERVCLLFFTHSRPTSPQKRKITFANWLIFSYTIVKKWQCMVGMTDYSRNNTASFTRKITVSGFAWEKDWVYVGRHIKSASPSSLKSEHPPINMFFAWGASSPGCITRDWINKWLVPLISFRKQHTS